jgi:hypothetical protein
MAYETNYYYREIKLSPDNKGGSILNTNTHKSPLRWL